MAGQLLWCMPFNSKVITNLFLKSVKGLSFWQMTVLADQVPVVLLEDGNI